MKMLLGLIILTSVFLCPSSSEANVLEGAQEYGGHYYKNFEFLLTWEEAELFCESMGGHLATAEEKQEISVINKAKKSGKRSHYWLGGIRDKDNLWRWVSGEIITHSNWAGNEPKEKRKYSTMVVYAYSGRWVSREANNKNGFICEWDSAADAHESTM